MTLSLLLVTAAVLLLLARGGTTTSECLNCTPERPCDTRAAIALALASYHDGGRNCTRLTLSSAHGMCSQLNTMLDALLRWNSVAADATLAPLSSAGWSIVNAVGHGDQVWGSKAGEYLNTAWCGATPSWDCFFEPVCRKRRATPVVVQRPPARAPFFDFVAGLMRFALRPSAALAAEIEATRAELGYPEPPSSTRRLRARVVSVHMRRRDKLNGGKDSIREVDVETECAAAVCAAVDAIDATHVVVGSDDADAVARLRARVLADRGADARALRFVAGAAPGASARGARTGEGLPFLASLFLLAEGDYFVASFGSNVARFLLPFIAARHCSPLWPRGYPLFVDFDRMISLENVTNRGYYFCHPHDTYRRQRLDMKWGHETVGCASWDGAAWWTAARRTIAAAEATAKREQLARAPPRCEAVAMNSVDSAGAARVRARRTLLPLHSLAFLCSVSISRGFKPFQDLATTSRA